MSSKQARLSAIAKRGRKLPAESLPAVEPLVVAIRAKRSPGGFWSMEKLYVPVPLALKCEVMRIAREAGMSQAQLGLVIVQAAVADADWLKAVLRSNR